MTRFSPNNAPFVIRFFNEIALYSGQYALFFIFMKLTLPGHFLESFGNVILAVTLIVQTTALVYYGSQIVPRLLLSFLSPLAYTFFEMTQEGWISFLNTGHLFFWFSTFILGVLQYVGYATTRQKVRFAVEFLVSNINIVIFIFLYFFFDLKLKLQEDLLAGKISAVYAQEELFVWRLMDGFLEFLDDPAHIYIILGGFFLSMTIAYGRIKILQLTEKIDALLVRYIGEEARDTLVQKDLEPFSTKMKTALLYCDIRNFTTLSEQHDAAKVVAMLNYYYGMWHRVIKAHEGVINKFIGDALLAFFSHSQEVTCNVSQAVRSALKMLASLEQINASLEQQNLPKIDGIGIGIHFGEVILGDIGGERKDYTLIGDAVNTTARLESLCKEYHTPLIISEACYTLLEESLQRRFAYLSSIALKGKQEMITFYGLAHRV
jgi:class 3 adenylate cyclase